MSLSHTGRRSDKPVTRTGNPPRRAFHALIAAVGWVCFGLFAFKVFIRPIDRTAAPTFLLLLALAAAIVAINTLWIRMNLQIFREREVRRRQPETLAHVVHDILGRPLKGADWDELRRNPHIEIGLEQEGRVKRYRPGDEDHEPWNG